ncbi:alpha-ketoacid dehydrogenase kinase [Thelephora ganbajun]|uniref:Alpha-ketoacid dehydrogenase kinase n=1 Tax=Thelephora ganbajun TaxID=370292 RepID=A0ACB6ZRL9_THEGA|nr:alpha-ketoacid dehydrogenase kinase [Thelephora ganbajun]
MSTLLTSTTKRQICRYSASTRGPVNYKSEQPQQRGQRRGVSDYGHFYRNRQLEQYAAKEARRLTLRQLVWFGRSMTEDRLIKSANYVRTELPVRISHRLRDMQALPYVVVTKEGVAKVYELYWSAFEKLRKYPPIETLEDNTAFCVFLREILDEHGPVIPSLSLGLSLSSQYLAPERLDSFMRRMLVSRISRRVLAEHHLALSSAFHGRDHDPDGGDHVGIIYTNLKVKDSIQRCVRYLTEAADQSPEEKNPGKAVLRRHNVVIDGQLDTEFSYIREHLEYIVFELLKNSIRATASHHHGASTSPEVRATIAASKDDVSIRISDQGGGLPNVEMSSDLFSFSHIRNSARLDDSRLGALRNASQSTEGLMATVAEQLRKKRMRRPVPYSGDGQPDLAQRIGADVHAKVGIGLPMSNIYARYFGGSLELMSLDGWGTDVYVRLPKLGTNLEGIEV